MHSLIPVFDGLLAGLGTQRQIPVASAHQAMEKMAKATDYPTTAARIRLASLHKDLHRICEGHPADEAHAKRLAGDVAELMQFIASFKYFRPNAAGFLRPLGQGFQKLLPAIRERIGPALTDPELTDIIRQELEVFGSTLDPRDSRIFQNHFFQTEREPYRALGKDLGISHEFIRLTEDRLTTRVFKRILWNRFPPSDPRKILIADLDLSARTVSCLWQARIYLIGELAEKTDEQLLEIQGLGKDGLIEIKSILMALGLGGNPAIFDEGIGILSLSSRSAACLAKIQVRQIGELVQRTEGDLLKNKNFGLRSLSEVKSELERIGLGLGMKIDWRRK